MNEPTRRILAYMAGRLDGLRSAWIVGQEPYRMAISRQERDGQQINDEIFTFYLDLLHALKTKVEKLPYVPEAVPAQRALASAIESEFRAVGEAMRHGSQHNQHLMDSTEDHQIYQVETDRLWALAGLPGHNSAPGIE